ncbi:restriction endonuclease subunit S domain-containing protein [Rubripirellula amarantea]|uniref:hypothetical protein n=1 Tax=Rubripirellula amarantea TaxID=2527999 RepID=UPI0011B59451|nr:hypothetical protein [Rubripirellula amarantea]
MSGTEGMVFYPEGPIDGLTRAKGRRVDAVVSCPPWNQSLPRERFDRLDVEGIKYFEHLVILESCRHLSEDGVGIFVVPSSFFDTFVCSERVQYELDQMGIRITSAIELPAGTFAPHTSITTHIVVMQKTDDETLFTGRFSDDLSHRTALLRNIAHRAEGSIPELGRFVDLESFNGFLALETNLNIVELAARSGLVEIPLKDAVSDIFSTNKADFKRLTEHPNAVYLPKMAATVATTNQNHLPPKLKSYFQLIVNPDIVDPKFLAGLLNTPFGQLWRDSLRTGSQIPTIGKQTLQSSKLYLPPSDKREDQTKVVGCQNELNRLKNELQEIELRLWDRILEVDQTQKTIQNVNRSNSFEDWLDTLPFPLASILWSIHTKKDQVKEQNEQLLHFFEALGEFIAVILLSGFSSSEQLYPQLQPALGSAFKNGNLSIRRATFGTWAAVVGSLAKELRRQRNDNEEVVFAAFRTRNRDLLDVISSRKLVTLLQETNKIRNDARGHSGAVSKQSAQEVNDRLNRQLQVVRDIFGQSWEGVDLLLPGDCRMKQEVFEYRAQRIMGTRTPFSTRTVPVVEAMEDERLYLKTPNERRGLKLLPFIKVIPSPKTGDLACYFFNRFVNSKVRFLSYYFEPDSEVVGNFGDVQIAIDLLEPLNADSHER